MIEKTQNPTHKNSYKALCLIIISFVMISIGISLVSSMEWDNIKNIKDEKGRAGYNNIEIRNAFGLGKLLWGGSLDSNTEFCGKSCSATQTITLFEGGSLVDEIMFRTLQGDGSWEEQPIKSYEIYLKTYGQPYQVNDFETQCNQEYHETNKTFYEVCKYIEVGSHTEYPIEWQPYTLGNKLGIGTYEIRLEGTKRASKTVDWVYKTQGETLNEWAVWGGTEANVTLNSPANDSTNPINLINFSCSAITDGNTILTNISLYHNGSGTFGRNQTVDLRLFNESLVANQSEDSDESPIADAGWKAMTFNVNGTFLNTSIFVNKISMKLFESGDISGFTNVSFMITGLNATNGVNFSNVLVSNTTISPDQLSALLPGTPGIFLNVSFSTPIFLNHSKGYAIVINTTGSGVGSLLWRKEGSNPYIFGKGWDSADEGAIWGEVPGGGDPDFAFEVYSGGITSVTQTFVSSITTNPTTWSCEACDNEGDCGFAPNNRTVSYAILERESSFETSIFETQNQNFVINVTSINDTTTVSADLIYDGTTHTGTVVNTEGDNYTASVTITTPLETSPPANKTFFWSFDVTRPLGVTNVNTTNQSQIVNEISFVFCNVSTNVIYLNVTFLNETANQERVDATIDSTFRYYTDSVLVNKTLSFANTTENPEYAFCFSPANLPINAITDIAYNNLESQQRIFNGNLLLTNVSATQTLHLLPTILGLFSQFQTITTTGNPIAGVLGTITRVLGGSTITSVVDSTDSSGLVVFFLNPDATYSATFSLAPFPDNAFSFVPTTDTRIVTMGGQVGVIGNGTQIVLNTTYTILPANSSLNNNTDYTFSFEVASSQDINFMSMNITNSSGGQLIFLSDTSATTISQVLNTANNTRIIGYYVIRTTDETITFTKIWAVGSEFIGDYSLFRQLTLFLDYNFTNIIRILLMLGVIIGAVIFLSIGEITDTSESKIMVSLLLVWVFSFVGWLDTGLIVNSTSSNINTLGELSNQFGIAILSTSAGAFFILRRLFIRRI